MQFRKIDNNSLNSRQQEIFNFQKISGVLADYGFNCIKLADDWQGADFLAYHKDRLDTLKVQLKSRFTINEKYKGKELFVAFPHKGHWYLVEHDILIEKVGHHTSWLNTDSWVEKGCYHSASPNTQLLQSLSEYKLSNMQFCKIDYNSLNSRQQEIFNFQKISGVLADYGFNCIKLTDDWQAADFLAYHKDRLDTLKVQLKSRLTINEKYKGKELFVAFPNKGHWYLVEHDMLIEKVGHHTSWLSTDSWVQKGCYHSASPNTQLLQSLSEYKL